jgi:hypothetical protein
MAQKRVGTFVLPAPTVFQVNVPAIRPQTSKRADQGALAKLLLISPLN